MCRLRVQVPDKNVEISGHSLLSTCLAVAHVCCIASAMVIRCAGSATSIRDNRSHSSEDAPDGKQFASHDGVAEEAPPTAPQGVCGSTPPAFAPAPAVAPAPATAVVTPDSTGAVPVSALAFASPVARAWTLGSGRTSTSGLALAAAAPPGSQSATELPLLATVAAISERGRKCRPPTMRSRDAPAHHASITR